MMAIIYNVDFLDKKLLSKVDLSAEDEKIPDMPEQATLDKLSYFSELVGNNTVAVKANTQHEKALVPEALKAPLVTMNFSHNFKPSDLKYDELAITQTLSFSGQMFHCKIPWEAVTSIALTHGGEARVWPKDSPPQKLNFINKPNQEETDVDPEPPPLRA